MGFVDKIKVVLSQKYVGNNFKPHDGEYYCNEWWCHKVKYETVKLSELKTTRNKIDLNERHLYIQNDILNNGFDYNMGYIIVTSKNVIMNGHHRYKILMDNFGEDYQITIVKLLDIKDLKIYFFKFVLTRIVVNLLWLFTKKRKEKHITLKF